jgi:hypothetical protein
MLYSNSLMVLRQFSIFKIVLTMDKVRHKVRGVGIWDKGRKFFGGQQYNPNTNTNIFYFQLRSPYGQNNKHFSYIVTISFIDGGN